MMTIETFQWTPKLSPTGSTKFRVLKAQFGDGYAQTAEDGLNNKIQSWPLTFTRSAKVIAEIQAFLDRHRGAKSFYWTPPLSDCGLYKAGEYSATPNGGDIYTLTVTLQQDFKP